MKNTHFRVKWVFLCADQQPKPNSEQSIFKKLFIHMTVSLPLCGFPLGMPLS